MGCDGDHRVLNFLNYDNFGLGEVVSEVGHRGMIVFKHCFFEFFLGTKANLIILKKSAHT